MRVLRSAGVLPPSKEEARTSSRGGEVEVRAPHTSEVPPAEQLMAALKGMEPELALKTLAAMVAQLGNVRGRALQRASRAICARVGGPS